MRRRSGRTWPTILLLAAAAATAVAQTLGPAAPADSSSTTRAEDALVDKLNADSAADRFDAQKALAAEGIKAVPRLQAALADPRPEVHGRALWALRFIRLMTRDGTDLRARGLARAYLNTTDPAGRKNLLKNLNDMQPPPDAVFFRLYTMESDNELRALLLKSPGAGFDEESTRLILEGDTEAVGELLEGMVSVNSRAAGPGYAMFAKKTGRLEETIRRWKAQFDNAAEPEDKKLPGEVLAFLYRAAGRPRDAVAMGRESGNPWITLAVMAQQSDWRGFENEPGLSQVFTPVIQAGFKASAERLQGRPESAAAILKGVGNSGNDDASRFVPSRAFLLNDDPELGIGMLTASRPDVAIRFLMLRADYHRAMEVGKAALAADPANAAVKFQMRALDQRLGLSPAVAAMANQIAPGPPTRPASPTDLAVDDLKQKRFKQAAERFAKLAREAPDHPALLYLQGYATTAAGDKAAGDALMNQADLIPLGDPLRRWRYATEIGAAGLADEREKQLAECLTTGYSFEEIGYSELYATRSQEAIKAGRWGDAAAALDRLVFVNNSPDMTWNEPLRFITVPADAHLMHARDFWSRGIKDKALAEYDRYENYLPVDDEEVIEVVTKLDAAGDHDGADKRFKRLWDLRTAGCRDFPKSPDMTNNAAWLAACCNRNLDEALVYAETNLKLSPGTSAMDTLGEVHFRRGERDAAVELSKQILAIAPADEYAKRQAARWASAPVPSTTEPVDEPK